MSKQLQERERLDEVMFSFENIIMRFFPISFFSLDICSVYSGVGCLLPHKKKRRTKIIQKQRYKRLWWKIIFCKGAYRMTFTGNRSILTRFFLVPLKWKEGQTFWALRAWLRERSHFVFVCNICIWIYWNRKVFTVEMATMQ